MFFGQSTDEFKIFKKQTENYFSEPNLTRQRTNSSHDHQQIFNRKIRSFKNMKNPHINPLLYPFLLLKYLFHVQIQIINSIKNRELEKKTVFFFLILLNDIIYYINLQVEKMYSVDKSGRLKKQIDRYFLPVEINTNILMDIIKIQQKKNFSPTKTRQETFNKITEQSRRLEMLKITGKQLNSNFTPLHLKSGKPKLNSRQTRLSPKKQVYKYKIQQILNEPLEDIVQTISRDPESYHYMRELEQLSKFKSAMSQSQLKTTKSNTFSQPSQDKKISSIRQHFQTLILANPLLYRKMILAHHKLECEKQEKLLSCQKKQKRPTLSEAIMTKRMSKNGKKVLSASQKQLSAHELKRVYNFIQYRQFLMTINLSNKIVIYPENEMQYKAFICKGNNGILVKSIIKSRPWWSLRSYSDIDNCSLVWTEWKKTKMTNSLPSKQIKVQRISFYASNYYERISHQSLSLQSQIQKQKQDSKIVCHTEVVAKNSRVQNPKLTHINKIVNSQKCVLAKFLNTDQSDANFYSFTRKINEKKFEELSKKNLPPQPSYYTYNNQIKGRDGQQKILNHLPGCLQLHSKKLLFLNMRRYYEKMNKQLFDYLPQTHLIKEGLDDPNFLKFVERWEAFQTQKNDPTQKNKTKNVWICKPGENSNRGNGITVVSSVDQVRNLIKSMNVNNNRTLIVQKYMQNPYLYNKRKFDIRCYLLITTVNGILKGYFFNEGYIRTTSKQYNLKNLENKFIHLTNDAIQKKGEEYGKFQSCNKLSFSDFQKYLQTIQKDQPSKFIDARKKIKEMVVQLVNAVAHKLNPNRKQFCFQLFGLDFMLDAKMKPYLIQANSNPCLQVDGSVLSKIIPTLIQNTIRVAIDPLFPPPYSQNPKTCRFSPGSTFQQNKFQLIYDSLDDPNSKDISTKIQDLKELQEEQQQCEKQQQNQFE